MTAHFPARCSSRDVDSSGCSRTAENQSRHNIFSFQPHTLRQRHNRASSIVNRLTYALSTVVPACTDRKKHEGRWVDDGNFSDLFINLVQPFSSHPLATVTNCPTRQPDGLPRSAPPCQMRGWTPRLLFITTIHSLPSTRTVHLGFIRKEGRLPPPRSPFTLKCWRAYPCGLFTDRPTKRPFSRSCVLE